jgi:hypothetical protein
MVHKQTPSAQARNSARPQLLSISNLPSCSLQLSAVQHVEQPTSPATNLSSLPLQVKQCANAAATLLTAPASQAL